MQALVGRRQQRSEHRRGRRHHRRRHPPRNVRSFRAAWVSGEQRLVVLGWGYADCLAFLLVRNGAAYACVFSRGRHGAAATIERLS